MKSTEKEHIGLSIIIPTCNSGKTIKFSIGSIIMQKKYLRDIPIEIIIIDCYSTDETIKIINEFKRKYSNLIEIKILRSKFKPFLARLIGIIHSSYSIIMFVDSDQVLSQKILKEILDLISQNVDAVVLKELSILLNKYSLLVRIINSYRFAINKNYLKYVGVSVFPRCYKRKLLSKVLKMIISLIKNNKYFGYYLALIHYRDDLILFRLVQRLAGKEIRVKATKSFIYHMDPQSLKEFIHKFLMYGINSSIYRTVFYRHVNQICLGLPMLDTMSMQNIPYSMLLHPLTFIKIIPFLVGGFIGRKCVTCL